MSKRRTANAVISSSPPTPLTEAPSVAKSLPSLIGVSSNTNNESGSYASSSTKCRGEFCRYPRSALPGLFPRSIDQQNDQNNNGDSAIESFTSILPDNGQRYKIGNNSILLAHAELEFLTGAVFASNPDADITAITLKWQETDNVIRMELGRSNPTQFYKQVLVCGNCHRIYSELNRMCENGFRIPQYPHNGNIQKQVKKVDKVKTPPKPSVSPESEASGSNDYYDQLFMEELAKHSGKDNVPKERKGKQDELVMNERAYLNGSEQDEKTSAKLTSRSSNNDRGQLLPSLSNSAKSRTKKKSPTLSVNDQLLRMNNNSNLAGSTSQQQSDEHEVVLTMKTQMAKLVEELADVKAKFVASEAQKHQMEQKVLQTHAQCTAMLREKEDQHRKQLLEQELSYHTKQSNEKKSSDGNAASSSADEITNLIETIDSLNSQLDQANERQEQLRKQLTQTHLAELKRVREKYQMDMEALRLSEYSAKESVESAQMQVLALQNQAHVATTQARNAKAALEDVTKNKLVALEEKNQRLERQVAEMKSQQQLAKGSSTTSSIISPSSSSQEMEALEKRFNNKIEYLKAQLASEMKCKEELGNHLAQITSAMESMKKDKKQALIEQEEAYKRQSERMESAFSQEKDVFMSQQAALQGKIVTLQANVTDLVQELTLWKSKEANAKLSLDKMVEENVRLTRQIVDLEGQVETLQEERKHDSRNLSSISVKNANEETNRMQMEALLRRLDNERQYLKNQLENEQEMKEKSQQQVIVLQSEITHLQDTIEQAAKASELKQSVMAGERLNEERQLRETVECLEEEKVLLTRQLKEIQAKFAQAREQALLDRDEVEKARIDMTEMRNQLVAAKEETLKEREYGKNASERMSKSLAAVKKSLHVMEEEKNLRIRHLEEEHVMYMTKLATTQGDMLVLEEKWSADKAQLERQHGIARLAQTLRAKCSNWILKQQWKAFCVLRIHNAVSKIGASLVKRHREALDGLEDRLSKDYMDKCDQMTQSLHDEQMEAIRVMKENHDKDREELYLYYEQEKSQLQEDLAATHAQQCKDLQEHYESSIKAIEAKSNESLLPLQTSYDVAMKDKEELTEALSVAKMNCERMRCEFEKKLSELTLEWEDKQAAWFVEKEQLESEYQRQCCEVEAKMEAKMNNALHSHERSIEELTQRLKQDEAGHIQHVIADMSCKTDEKIQLLKEKHSKEMADVATRYRAELDAEITELKRQWQEDILREREQSEKHLKTTLEQVESKAKRQLETLQKEMNERRGNAVVQCTSKWQRAMEELQERLEVEKQMAYANGQQDREKEWQQAAQQIKLKQKDELENVQKEALRAIQAAEERHKMQTQANLVQLKKEFEARHSKEMKERAEEITSQVQKSAQEAYDKKLEDITEELRIRSSEDMEAMKKQLEDINEHTIQQLRSSFTQEKEAMTREFQDALVKELAKVEKEWIERLESMEKQKASEHSSQMENLREELSDEYDDAAKQLRDSFRLELETQLKEQETRLLSEQEDAIAQVQEESEKLMEQVEAAMSELKKQKDNLENELVKLRSALEAAEDSHFDVEENLKKQQKSMAFQLMVVIMHAKRCLMEEQSNHAQLVTELQGKHDRLQEERTREQKQWSEEVSQIRTTWTQIQTKHDEMLQMLTNYKRDELVAHRSASAVLSNEISIVSKQMEEVQELKAALEKEVEQLQAEAHAVEANLRQLKFQNSSSSISSHGDSNGGSMSMAAIAKKRRLNEEFEALLEQIEKKNAEISNVKKTCASLRARREEKEQEMKVMERKLVEFLVQQQKHMLMLLTSVRELSLPAIVTIAPTIAS